MKIGTENETLEFKKSTGELKEGIISIVSILNKHNIWLTKTYLRLSVSVKAEFTNLNNVKALTVICEVR